MARLLTAFAAAALIALGTGPAQAQQVPTLVMTVTEGGPMRDVFARHVPRFEAEQKVKVNFVTALGAPTLTLARNKEVDVLITDPIYSLQMEDEKRLVELKEQEIPNLAQLYKASRLSPYQYVLYYGSYGIAYRPDKIAKIEEWSDLWKPELKGKVSVRSFRPDSISLLVTMAKLAGGGERSPDAGFKKMAELAKDMPKFYSNWPELVASFRSGEVWAATITNGRADWMNRTQGLMLHFVNPKPGGFALVGALVLVDGRPHQDLAKKLYNFLMSAEVQKEMAETLGYGPSNTTVKLSPEVAAKVPSTRQEVESLILIDWRYVNSVNSQWEERWNKEVAFK
ncbi:MAG: extracellular solute-binding protein [Pseudomonadota bacterium]